MTSAKAHIIMSASTDQSKLALNFDSSPPDNGFHQRLQSSASISASSCQSTYNIGHLRHSLIIGSNCIQPCVPPQQCYHYFCDHVHCQEIEIYPAKLQALIAQLQAQVATLTLGTAPTGPALAAVVLMDTPQLLHINDLFDYSTKWVLGIYEQRCKTLDNKALTGGFGMTPDQAVVFVQSLTRRATTMGWNTVSEQIIILIKSSGKTVAWNMLACVAVPPLLDTGQLNTITFLFIFLLPIINISLMLSILPENPRRSVSLCPQYSKGLLGLSGDTRGPSFVATAK
jgi:hypothetical protein